MAATATAPRHRSPIAPLMRRCRSAVPTAATARADANGQFRLAENLRQVQASLDHIIPALEALDEKNARP